MKRQKPDQEDAERDEMLPEYDFSGMPGARGKYHKAYREGHTVEILGADGTTTVHYFKPEEGAVMLVLEAMKMEHPIIAHGAGVVTEVRVEVDQMVEPDEVLVVVKADD